MKNENIPRKLSSPRYFYKEMTKEDIEYTKWCIENDIHRFYTWSKWLRARRETLKADRGECQDCKRCGVITKATTVHHNFFLKQFPEYALERDCYINDKKKRNLTSLCYSCHEKRHKRTSESRELLTEEKW